MRMQPSQPCPSRWPNPNMAASARENGPFGMIVNDPADTVCSSLVAGLATSLAWRHRWPGDIAGLATCCQQGPTVRPGDAAAPGAVPPRGPGTPPRPLALYNGRTLCRET